jgi:hypothetical protein
VTHLQEGCPINKQRGNFSAVALKEKVKLNVKNQKPTDSPNIIG